MPLFPNNTVKFIPALNNNCDLEPYTDTAASTGKSKTSDGMNKSKEYAFFVGENMHKKPMVI